MEKNFVKSREGLRVRRERLRLPGMWEPVHVDEVLIRLGILAAGLFIHQASGMAAVVTELGTCNP
jgi:hypothetical protein